MASGNSHKRRIDSLDLQDNQQLVIKWEDVICPICLDIPHNGVLLYCSSFNKGCLPFICDTDHYHSNCLDRFKTSYKLPSTSAKASSSSSGAFKERIQAIPTTLDSCPTCPLCRGVVTGWVVIDEARLSLNSRKRCCEERGCSYMGTYDELQAHANENHLNACPSEIDPARQRDWENFQQSSEIIDVLSTIHSEVPHGVVLIHSEVPHGVVLCDYVIEYGNESGDEYEDFPGDVGNWWTSCILYQVFDNFRASRRRRSRASDLRRGRERSAYDASNAEEGSVLPPDFGEYQFDDSDVEFTGSSHDNSSLGSIGSSTYRSYRRCRSRLHDP